MEYLKTYEGYKENIAEDYPDLDPIAKELIMKYDIEFEDAIDLSEVYDMMMVADNPSDKQELFDDFLYNGYYQSQYSHVWDELENYVLSWADLK